MRVVVGFRSTSVFKYRCPLGTYDDPLIVNFMNTKSVYYIVVFQGVAIRVHEFGRTD